MKKRFCVTAALIAALALLPYRPARAQQTEPKVFVEVVCGFVVIFVGAWICYSIYKVCKKIPDQKPDDQQDPQPPPQGQQVNPKANAVPNQAMMLDDSSGVLCWDCSTNNWADPVTGALVTAIMKTRVQSSEDLHTWTDEVAILGYCSASGIQMVYSCGGSPVCTNYLAHGATNAVNLKPSEPLSARKFYRLAEP